MYAPKRKIIAFVAALALFGGLSVLPALADAGGGPGISGLRSVPAEYRELGERAFASR